MSMLCLFTCLPSTRPIPTRRGKRTGLTKKKAALLSDFLRVHLLRFPARRGDVDDIRTYVQKWPRLVRSVYQLFRKRSSCLCEACQADPFDAKRSIAQLKNRPRWNSLPKIPIPCVFTKSRKRRKLLGLLGERSSRMNLEK